VSAAFQLLLDCMEAARTLERLLETLNPEAGAPLEDLTPFAEAWRKFREADLAADCKIIGERGEKHSPEVEEAIRDREELDSIIAAMPSGSPAGALVRILWAVLHELYEVSHSEGKAEPNSMWQATLFEAALDLLQPGVLKRIAAGLIVETPGAETIKPGKPPIPFDVSVPAPTPDSDAALIEATRRLRKLNVWWGNLTNPWRY
jgi:hypothetical protein